MTATKLIRDKLGLSQEELAQFLSVTRSRLSLYEIGKRDLTTSATIKLSEILLFIQQPPAKKDIIRPHIELHRAKMFQMLAKHRKEQEYQQILAERKLAATKKVYAQKMLLLDMVDHFKDRNKSVSTDNSWLSMMEKSAIKRIDETGLHVQAMLQLKVSVIKHQQEQV